MKRILVTGAGGFVAGHLVPYLANSGFSVIAATRGRPLRFDHPHVTTVWLPASDVGWMALLQDVDAVVHLAGLAHQTADVEKHDQANRLLAAQVAEAVVLAGVEHFILVSSIAAQAGATSADVLTEDDEPQPGGAYGEAKLAAEIAVASSGAPFTILRPVVINGPGTKGNAALLHSLARIPLPMPFGGLTNKRSMLSIANFNSAVRTVLFNPKAIGETFIVADPEARTIAETFAAARKQAGRSAMLFNLDPKYLKLALRLVGRGELWERVTGSLVADPSKLLSIGWTPERPE